LLKFLHNKIQMCIQTTYCSDR